MGQKIFRLGQKVGQKLGWRQGILGLSFWAFFLFSCAQKLDSINFFALDTPCSITLQDYVSETLLVAAKEEVLGIEAAMSSYLEESEIGLLNREGQYILSPATFALVQEALNYAEQSNGLFDPTIGPLSKLWNIAGTRALSLYRDDDSAVKNLYEEFQPPALAAISAALSLVSYRNVELDINSRQVRFVQSGMKLDLGGITKGFAADRLAAMLLEAGAPPGVIDLGGNILLHGKKNDGSFWSVGVRGEGDTYLLGMFVPRPQAIVTSGIYQRYYMYEGRRYHHILSPETGYPVANGLFSVTVLADRSTVADVMATMLFVYGVEKGLENIARRQARGEKIEALFITEDQQVFASSGFALLSDSQYEDLNSGKMANKELPSNKIWLFLLQEKLRFVDM